MISAIPIQMDTIMKNNLKPMTIVRAVLVVAATLSLARTPAALGSPPPTPISYQWQFVTGASPLAPDVSTGGTGTASATITPGQFSDGWLEENPVFGYANGVWDLGRSGTITLSNASGLAG